MIRHLASRIAEWLESRKEVVEPQEYSPPFPDYKYYNFLVEGFLKTGVYVARCTTGSAHRQYLKTSWPSGIIILTDLDNAEHFRTEDEAWKLIYEACNQKTDKIIAIYRR